MSMNIEITNIEDIFGKKHYQGTVDNINFSYSPSDKEFEWTGTQNNIKKLGKPFQEWEKEAKKRIKNLVKAFDRQK